MNSAEQRRLQFSVCALQRMLEDEYGFAPLQQSRACEATLREASKDKQEWETIEDLVETVREEEDRRGFYRSCGALAKLHSGDGAVRVRSCSAEGGREQARSQVRAHSLLGNAPPPHPPTHCHHPYSL